MWVTRRWVSSQEAENKRRHKRQEVGLLSEGEVARFIFRGIASPTQFQIKKVKTEKSLVFPPFVLELPEWVTEYLSESRTPLQTPVQRMALVIQLSRLNVQHGTGGPFAAAVFDCGTHRLVAPGVNLVTSSNSSVAHAEMVAILFAQQVLGHYDLGAEELALHELVTSSEPCAMCLGAIPWSGVRYLTCGARQADVEDVGFDEGSRPSHWVHMLEGRGITVHRDVMRGDAVSVLQAYVESGGVIYNGRKAK